MSAVAVASPVFDSATAVKEANKSPFPVLDSQMKILNSNKDKWVNLPLAERIAILEEIRVIMYSANFLSEWANAASRAKGYDPLDPAMAPFLVEETFTIGMVAYSVTEKIRFLSATKEENGKYVFPKPTMSEVNGQKVAKVFPHMFTTSSEPMLFPGVSIDVVIQKDKSDSQGAELNQKKGKVCVVLGAGNADCVAPLDSLYKLYCENQVVMLKYNPVNDHCAFFVDKLLSPLIKRGFLFSCKGAAEEGRFLTSHPLAETLHLTGSDKTYCAIVWGGGPQQAENMRNGTMQNARPFSCELGAVSPWVIAAGDVAWTDAEIRHHARQLAAATALNAGFICASPKVLILPKRWAQRQQFLNVLEEEYKTIGSRPAYYPGADQRQAAFIAQYPQAKVIKSVPSAPNALPHVLITDVPAREGEYALQNEAFAQVLAEVPVDAPSTEEFLKQAVAMVNNKKMIWGNLSMTVVAHSSVPAALVDTAAMSIRYGAVGINTWGGLACTFAPALWGGYPGASPKDPQSGNCFVNNLFLFDNPEKCIVRTPFVSLSHFGAQKGSVKLMQRLTYFFTYPSMAAFSKVILAATTGL